MTIYPYTFASIENANFPVGANNDGRLYQILANKMANGEIKRYDFQTPVNTSLNRQYTGTAILAGGRYFELINEQVTLIANVPNYITANIDLSNAETPITISVEASDLSNTTDINTNNGILRVCFETVTTNGSSVVSATPRVETETFQNVVITGSTSVKSLTSTQINNSGNLQTGSLTSYGSTTLQDLNVTDDLFVQGAVTADSISVTGDSNGWQTLLTAGKGKYKCVNGTVTIQWDITQGGTAGNFALGDLPAQYVPPASIMTGAIAFSGATTNDTHMQINGGSGGGGITILSAKANQRYAGQFKFDI